MRLYPAQAHVSEPRFRQVQPGQTAVGTFHPLQAGLGIDRSVEVRPTPAHLSLAVSTECLYALWIWRPRCWSET